MQMFVLESLDTVPTLECVTYVMQINFTADENRKRNDLSAHRMSLLELPLSQSRNVLEAEPAHTYLFWSKQTNLRTHVLW